MTDFLLTLASWLLLAVFVVGAGAALAALVLWVARRPRRPARSVNGATVRKVHQYQTPGALAVVEAEAEPEDLALAPYNPQPAPLIRINTQNALPVADNGPGWELERRTPHRTPSIESDFAVPALQAGMTALAVGVGAALMAWAFTWSWRVPVAVMGATFVLSWLWRLRIVDGLLWTVESIIRRDVTGDGQVGAPTPQHAYTLVNPAQARTEAAQAARTQEDDTRRAELLDFLHRCYTVGTGVRAHDANNLGPVRDRYIRLRGTLMQLGVARWTNPDKTKAGWLLTVDEPTATEIIMRHTT